MAYTITVETVSPRILAAVRRRVRAAEIKAAFAPALDEVWAFLRSHPGLRTDGHNIFLYHHASGHPATGMDVDFGVEVTRHFEAENGIACVETPNGWAAVTVHRGPYGGIPAAHEALHQWCRENDQRIGLWTLEIYGDWTEDENKLETTIVYALT
jgi:effector-binding domain-containing protein